MDIPVLDFPMLSLLLIVSYFAYHSLNAAHTKATVSVLNVGQGVKS